VLNGSCLIPLGITVCSSPSSSRYAGKRSDRGCHEVLLGRLPDDPTVLEKEIEGVGRYTAGAICSMAYGVTTPIVSRPWNVAGKVAGG
jgi:hypothetical protein